MLLGEWRGSRLWRFHHDEVRDVGLQSLQLHFHERNLALLFGQKPVTVVGELLNEESLVLEGLLALEGSLVAASALERPFGLGAALSSCDIATEAGRVGAFHHF